MIDDLLTFLLLAPGWVTGLVLLAGGSRARGLSRPLRNGARVDGMVVAHERWLLANGRERTGIVVDFCDDAGHPGRLIEPPVRWERPPAVGSRVRVSHRPDDLGFAKRYSRRQQVFAWIATVVSMPIVILFLLTHPLFMSIVVVPQVAWLTYRRLRPPASPIRQPADLSLVGPRGFDPKAMIVPTSPPSMGDPIDRPGPIRGTDEWGVPRASVLELLHRSFYPVVSAAVVGVVALIGASRSSQEFAFGWHVGLASVLGLGIVLFETSLASRGGSVVDGRVVDHHLRRDTEGDVYWLEVVEFRSDRGLLTFVDTAGHRRQRPVGSSVTVSYRSGSSGSGERQQIRSLHRSQSLLGTVMIAGTVGVGLFVSAPTWLPVIVQTAVCYVGYVVLDVVRGFASTAAVPQARNAELIGSALDGKGSAQTS